MTFHLRPGRPEDLDDFVQVYFDAFASNIMARRVFPASSSQAQTFWRESLADELKDPNARFIVVEDESTTPPTFVAFAKWNIQDADTKAQPMPPADIWPKDGDPEFAVDFFGKLWEQHERFMGQRPHWYLELIVTQPKYQGKGAGSLLIQWGVNEADKVGWECYLDSTPDGKKVYEKHGFREVDVITVLDGTYQHNFMIRPAK